MNIKNLKDLNLAADKGRIKNSKWSHFKEYIWMLWDGLEFFGFDDSKLARLRGAKTSVLDKFKNKKRLFFILLMFLIACYIVIREFGKIGTIKNQQIILNDQATYKFNATSALTMHAVNIF